MDELKLELGGYRREYQTFTEEIETQIYKDETRESMRDIAKLKSDVVLLSTDVAGLKRDTWRIKKIAKNDIEELKSELVFREVIESDNIIVVEVSKDESHVCVGEFLQEPQTVILFDNVDKITKLKGNLFHFGP